MIYPPTDKEILKSRIRTAFHSWQIFDPYPLLTDYEIFKQMEHGNLFERFLNWVCPLPEMPPPQSVSPHQAWREGYEFAKNLVMKELEK